MDPLTTAAVIGGGSAIIGGLLNRDAIDRANDQNAQIAATNIAKQEQFAKQGIGYKVQDARASGIHPLYALGANTTSFSPVSVGAVPDTSIGDAMTNMGQNVSNAVMRSSTQLDRQFDTQMKMEQLKNAKLQNTLLEGQITSINKPTNPGLPSNSGLPGSLTGAGQGDAYVLEQPLKRTHSAPGLPSQEVGHVADVGWARTATGLVPVPSADVKERIEDSFIPETMWSLRNQLMPNITSDAVRPSPSLLPKGATHWEWSYTGQEWRPAYKRPSYEGSNKVRNIMDAFDF